MAISTEDSSKIIKDQDTGITCGQMVANTKAGGIKTNSMDLVFTILSIKSSLAFGKWVKEFNGLMKEP